jgi:hypothetical protein
VSINESIELIEIQAGWFTNFEPDMNDVSAKPLTVAGAAERRTYAENPRAPSALSAVSGVVIADQLDLQTCFFETQQIKKVIVCPSAFSAKGFNIFNIANLTGYGGALNAHIRPTAPSQTNPKGTPGRPPNQNEFTFGQPNNRVSPIFGTGGPRAFQLAARLSF